MRDMRVDQDQNPFAPPSDDADWGLKATFTGGVDASRGKRFAGAFLDNLLYYFAFLLSAFLVVPLMGEPDVGDFGFGVPFLAIGALWLYQAYLVTKTGQTIGKRMVGSRIVHMDGTRVGFIRDVFVRSWIFQAVFAIPVVGGLVGLLDALLIFGDSRRCLHDYVVGTRVVDVPRWK